MIRYLPPVVVALAAVVVMVSITLGGHIYRWEEYLWLVSLIGLSIAYMLQISANRHLADANATRAETIRIYEDMHR